MRKSSPHNLFPPPHTKNFTGEPRGSNCAKTVCQSALPTKSHFFKCLTAFHSILPLRITFRFSSSATTFLSPLRVTWTGWLRWYCTTIPLASLLFFFFFLRQMGRKSFQPQTVNAEHDFRRVTIPPEQQQVNILLLYIEEETSVVIG